MPTTPALDGATVVQTAWPLDGPYTPEALGQLMSGLEEMVRYANHATIVKPAAALPAVDDGAIVIRRLGSAFDRLPQLLDQLASWAEQVAADPRLSACHGTDPDGMQSYPLEAAQLLREAAASVGQLHLGHAAAALGRVYLDTGEEDPDDE